MSTAPRWDADAAVDELYAAHYRQLVRLSVLLVRDVETAEEVVQDSFVAMHGRWRRLRDPDKGLAYLRQTVVNRSRSVLRHRGVQRRGPQLQGGRRRLPPHPRAPRLGRAETRRPRLGRAGAHRRDLRHLRTATWRPRRNGTASG